MPLDPSDFDVVPSTPNPLDTVETVLSTYNLDYIRMDDDELILLVAGQCASYQLSLTWQDEFEALQIVCQYPKTFSVKTPETLSHLLMNANAQLWLGHFEMGEDDMIQFRYTTLLESTRHTHGVEHMNDLFKLAVAECDRFYPALKLIYDQFETTPDLLAFAMQDTVGQG